VDEEIQNLMKGASNKIIDKFILDLKNNSICGISKKRTNFAKIGTLTPHSAAIKGTYIE